MTKRQKKIIVVDDSPPTLTACKNTLKPLYEVYPAPSAVKMFDLLGHITPDLILLDVDMPEINGYEAAGRLKKDNALKEIPFIFLSGRIDPKSEMFGLNMGALDYIHKPFVGELLLRRIETHLSLVEYRKSPDERSPRAGGSPGPESKNDFPARINSEIYIPLSEIAGILGAAADTDNAGEIRNLLADANNASRRLLAHVKRILEESK